MTRRYVVVGAGSAGCVVANRLSADPTTEVLLLDDGPDLNPSSVPRGIEGPNFYAALDEPGRSHLDLLASRTTGGERTLYQRGRGVGGSSAVNAMVALRGSPALYERWGWNDTEAAWSNVVLPSGPTPDGDLGPIDRALLAADDRTQIAHLTRVNGRRVTSAEAYLWPVQHRENLSVRPNSEVESVLLDGTKACGVRLRDGAELAADAVILTAGAIHSPTVLLRSGVTTPGIGQGLQDHPSAVLTLVLRDERGSVDETLAVGSVLHHRLDHELGDDIVQLLPLNHVGADPEVRQFGALLVGLMTPRGHAGTVTIDADGDPVVDFALLDDEHDLDALTAGVTFALDVVSRPAFRKVVEAVVIDDGGTPAQALSDDAAVRSWLRANCGDYVHASSSCAMGTVVDADGAVAGYRNLFVCDASVFPTIPDANTHLPTTMLAERLCMRGGFRL